MNARQWLISAGGGTLAPARGAPRAGDETGYACPTKHGRRRGRSLRLATERRRAAGRTQEQPVRNLRGGTATNL